MAINNYKHNLNEPLQVKDLVVNGTLTNAGVSILTNITGNNINVTGISTLGFITATTLRVTGVSTVGVVTGATSVQATNFYGDGSGLTGISAGVFAADNTTNLYSCAITSFPSRTTGVNNFFVGFNAAKSLTSGSNNIGIGTSAGASITSGNSNNFLGYWAGRFTTTGSYNNFFGNYTGLCNTTGTTNNFFGNLAGFGNTSGYNNNFFGPSAGYLNSFGNNNNFFGPNTGFANTTGSYNNFFGNSAGFNNTIGSLNNFFGRCAGNLNTTGNYNNFFGSSAGIFNTTGSNNNFFGNGAGLLNNSGSDNIFFGRYAGCSNVTGSQNVAIGYNQQMPITSGSNQLVIGAGNTAWIYGNSSYNVGIGTTNPTSKFYILGDVLVTAGVSTFSGGLNASQGADLARLRVTGISTLGQTNTTGLSNAGISTLGNANASTLSVTGFSTLGSVSAANLTLAGVTTGINVPGISTLGFVQHTTLSVTGFSTLGSVSAANLTLAGITTGLNASGVLTATSFSGSGANLTSLNATQLTTGTVPAARITASGGDFTVGNNLYVNGILSVGGTTVILNVQQLQISDRDITLGVTTDVNGVDISTDNTANHGGISVASTVGTPIVNIPTDAVNNSPSTYKQIMWVKQGHYTGLATDAWIFNYGVSIGNTSTVQNGSRLTVGAGFTVYDNYIDALDIRGRNFNIVGVSTLGTASASSLSVSGISTFNDTVNVINNKYINVGSGIPKLQIFYTTDSTFFYNNEPYIYGTSSNVNVEVGSGKTFRVNHNGLVRGSLAEFTDNAGVKLYYSDGTFNPSVKKFETLGAGATVTGTTFTNQLSVSGVSTFSGAINGSEGADLARLRVTGITTLGQTNTTGFSNAGVSTLGNATASTLVISGFSTLGSISGANLTLAGITTGLNVSGVSTFTNGPVFIGAATSTGTASQPLQVNGGAYVSGSVGVATGSIGVGITNPQGALDIRTSPQWSSFNYGANLIIGGTRNNALGILDSTNSNPWAIGNNAGSLIFAQMPGVGNTTTPASEKGRFDTSGNLLIGTQTSTGTASQTLQVTGGAYVSGNLGIGSTNPTSKLHVVGSTLITGITSIRDVTIDKNTTSPNATIPVAVIGVTTTGISTETNIDVALVAKGTGATLAQVPDGTAVGGDKRGTYATDLQKIRSVASQVASANASVICGGQNNYNSGQSAFIGGGSGNTVSNTGATISGGNSNNASGDTATIAGGGANQATGTYSFVGGGQSNTAQTNTHATVVGGNSNTASGQYSFVGGGQSNTASSDRASIVGGYGNAANGSYSFVSGGANGNTRSIVGNHVFPACSSPILNSSGVTQSALLLLGRETTDATATVLTSNSSAASTTNQVVLPNNSAYFFKGSCIAGVTGAGNTKAWEFKGAIKRGATAGSTAIVGSVIKDVIASDSGASAWDITITADTTNGGIAVTVTGQAATTIRWVCKIETTEMTY